MAMRRAVGGPQDVGLRKPRAIAGGGGIAEGKKSRKRLDGEVCHRLEHRYLDQTTLAGPPRCSNAPKTPYAA